MIYNITDPEMAGKVFDLFDSAGTLLDIPEIVSFDTRTGKVQHIAQKPGERAPRKTLAFIIPGTGNGEVAMNTTYIHGLTATEKD